MRLPRAGRLTRRSTTRERSSAPGVGQHVRRVGEERERVGEDAGDDLADHERDDQRQAGAEPARVGALFDAWT